MVPQRFQLKLFLSDDSNLDLLDVIPVFHRWIQTQAVDGLLIDVANYAHVPSGPGVMLVGHDVDYAIDLSDGRAGLMLTRKPSRAAGGPSFGQQLQSAISSLFAARDTLLAETSLDLRFASAEIELRIADRLLAPNTASAYDALRADLQAAFITALGPVTLARIINDNRRPLTVRVQLETARAIA